MAIHIEIIKLYPSCVNMCFRTSSNSNSDGDQGNACTTITIIPRDTWGARPARSSSVISVPVPNIYIHHTDGNQCTSSSACITRMTQIQNYHMDARGYDDIGYSFLIGEDGKIYEGRGWDRIGAHTKNYYYNSRGYGISFIGNFMFRAPNTAALNAAKSLIQCGIHNGKISGSYDLYGHRDIKSTLCPGDTLYNIIQSWPHFHGP
ncbi:PGRP [Mytilus coruscus]|uniref:Peptidoglycan-recognition protein n=1 Tax=Mytilus coruscus TaxID=42192 RepID=A0A6J8BY32_MYTCO|nr:PGRP [Mytilus coruscus]